MDPVSPKPHERPALTAVTSANKTGAYKYRPPRIDQAYQVEPPELSRASRDDYHSRSCTKVWGGESRQQAPALARFEANARLLGRGAAPDEEQLLHFFFAHARQDDGGHGAAASNNALGESSDRALFFLRATAGAGHLGRRIQMHSEEDSSWLYDDNNPDGATSPLFTRGCGTGTNSKQVDRDRSAWNEWLNAVRRVIGKVRSQSGAKA